MDEQKKKNAPQPLTKRPSLSETSDQRTGRIFYSESTGRQAAERWAAADHQKTAHEARIALKKSQNDAKQNAPRSTFCKPETPNFDSTVSVPNSISERKYHQRYNLGLFHDNAFPPLPGEHQVRIPQKDVSASPELENRVINTLEDKKLKDMVRLNRNEQSWILKKDDTNEWREGIDPHRSICSLSEEGCLHIHPKDPIGIDATTDLRPDGQIADHGHRNKFGGGDWVPVESGVPNFIVGPAGDLWVMEAKDGEYITRQIKSRKKIFGE